MYKITSYEVHHLERRVENGPWIPVCDVHLSPYRVASQCVYITVPCGHCIGCRLEYSRQWANRCLLELDYHSSAYFVTLTYDNSHVRRTLYADPDTGEAAEAYTLAKRDFQLFMKRLRKAFPDQKIRYFAAGEYGSETFRPHYHAILFGLKLDDLQLYKQSPDGFNYYTSESFQRVWSEPASGVPPSEGRPYYTLPDLPFLADSCKGSTTPLTPIGKCLICDVSWETCAYVARYVTKKLTGPESTFYSDHNIEPPFTVMSDVSWETCAYVARYVTKKLTGPESTFYSDHNIEPPFTVMSRKPGIARQWYDDHPDLYDYDYINISTPAGGKKFRPPKYFDKLYDIEYPEESKARKELHKNLAEEAKKAKLQRTDLSYLEMLQVEEDAKLNAVKALRRDKL
ncbi:VP4 [Gokushovirus WZ-2015a]|nr:VP4 [Gokushovirus WZ-2015a]